MISSEEANQMSDTDLELKVSALLGDPHFFRMREHERRTNGYPVTREEMLEFVQDHWEESQRLIDPEQYGSSTS